MVIKDALLELNKETAYDKINVTMVCRQAEIARATFYLHFDSLDEVLDSVIVHELAHRKHMDHSKQFYEEVLKVFPDYHKWDKWLKDNGGILINRMKRGLS